MANAISFDTKELPAQPGYAARTAWTLYNNGSVITYGTTPHGVEDAKRLARNYIRENRYLTLPAGSTVEGL